VSRRSRGRPGTVGVRASTLLLACIAAALVLGGVARSAPARVPLSFGRPTSYQAGDHAQTIAIGDLNGDGKPDLVTAYLPGDVSVLRNSGDGSFARQDFYELNAYVWDVAIGDLDGDGSPDLAAVNSDNLVWLLHNRGDGTFESAREYATGIGPTSIAVSDLNGDGKPDLATANAAANTVSVLLNRGDGTFPSHVDYGKGRGSFSSIAVGDLNGDGHPDLVTANSGVGANTVSVLFNRGDGSFQAKVDLPAGRRPFFIAVGDLNGDGHPDLAATGVSGTVSVFFNRGDGSFAAKRDYATGGGGEPLAIGDLNGDGYPDLVTVAGYNNSVNNSVAVLLNRGKGNFEGKLLYAIGRPTSGSVAVAIGDLNGDGRLDLAGASIHNVGDASDVGVVLNTPGLCNVQQVKGITVAAAKRQLGRVNCRVGGVRHAYSKRIKEGRVISQKPKFGAVLPQGGKVNLIVSRGRR
jgi:hypothetical protein